MKLKLFIITLIAISFAVTGLLGGCGGKNKDKRDTSIVVDASLRGCENIPGTADGKNAYLLYEEAKGEISSDQIAGLVTVVIDESKKTVYIDTMYLLSGKIKNDNFGITLFNIDINGMSKKSLNFTATSSNSSVVSLSRADESKKVKVECIYYVTAHSKGTATISIKSEDGRKTWFTVKVVDSVDDLPKFTPRAMG